MMKRIQLIFIFCLIFGGVNSQITIDNTKTPEELVQEILLGTGVTVTNIKFNNSTANAGQIKTNAGEFGGNAGIGISNGVILSSGNIAEAVGPNSSGNSSDNTGVENYSTDADLQSLHSSGTQLADAAVLEFDFIPSGDSLSFKYVFASEEYPEFVCSNYNDGFGFFLTGPNPAGGNYTSTNIALIPGTTTPIAINNVNSGTPGSSGSAAGCGPNGLNNTAYYVDNAGGQLHEYDGSTIVLTAAAKVTCGETYHIKLAISDAGDQSYNSAIFLEANSFSSNAVQVSVATVTGDSTLIEGCANAQIIFSRPENDTTEQLTINYDIQGTAINGTDYTEIADSVVFQIGEDSVSITLTPIDDSIDEEPESVIITAYTINTCGDTITSVGTVWIYDPEVVVKVKDSIHPCPKNDSILLIADVTVGVAPYQYEWSTGSTNDSIWVPVSTVGTENYIVTATDNCSYSGKDTATITVSPYIASFTATPETGESPLNVVYTNTSPAGQTYTWYFGNGTSNVVNDLSDQTATFVDEGNYYTSLIMSNASGCVDTTVKEIIVVDKPSLEVPNVFTPNGDGVNDEFFFLNPKNVDTFECIIKNRWGNTIVTLNSVDQKWDGKDNLGNDMVEGVYFYYFKGASTVGTEVSGQGFVELKHN